VTGREWDLDMSSIFAQLNAFVQRCKDLQEVCEGQTQFARRGEVRTTRRIPLPSPTPSPSPSPDP
jgi:dynein heavy chain